MRFKRSKYCAEVIWEAPNQKQSPAMGGISTIPNFFLLWGELCSQRLDVESGRLRVVLFNRFFLPIYRFFSSKQTQMTQRNLDQQFPNPLTAKRMGIHRLSYRYPSVFFTQVWLPCSGAWLEDPATDLFPNCMWLCGNKKNMSSAGFASNIFEPMMQILTKQNLPAKLPPSLINIQRISTFKTTKEPPPDGVGAWCLVNADSWGLMLIFHKHPQPSSTTAPRKFPSWVSLGAERLPRLCEKVYGVAQCVEVRFQRWSTSWTNLQLEGRWPIRRLYVPEFRPSGHKVPQSATKCHKASPQITVFPPTHFEVPDPWQFCAGVCHPKENFAALVDSCCWRDFCSALFMS